VPLDLSQWSGTLSFQRFQVLFKTFSGLAGFFFAILLFRIGLDLVAFLARFFIPGIGTSSS
jgi:hypothetical protein